MDQAATRGKLDALIERLDRLGEREAATLLIEIAREAIPDYEPGDGGPTVSATTADATREEGSPGAASRPESSPQQSSPLGDALARLAKQGAFVPSVPRDIASLLGGPVKITIEFLPGG